MWQFLSDNLDLVVVFLLFGGGGVIALVAEGVFDNLASAVKALAKALAGDHGLRRRVRELEEDVDELLAARHADAVAMRRWVEQANATLAGLDAQTLPAPGVGLEDWPAREDETRPPIVEVERVRPRPRRGVPGGGW